MHAVVLFTLSFYARYFSVHTLLLCALSSAHTLFYTRSTPDTPIAGARPFRGGAPARCTQWSIPLTGNWL